MLSASELKFATRQRGELPGWLRPQKGIRIWPLAQAKTLALRHADRNVVVKLRERSTILLGEVTAFEPAAKDLNGVHIGDLIVFNETHVFAASE